jgi:hypothetical protein
MRPASAISGIRVDARPAGRQQRGRSAQTLTRPSGFALGTAMRSTGLDENRALTLACGSGLSLTVLARLIPGARAVISSG